MPMFKKIPQKMIYPRNTTEIGKVTENLAAHFYASQGFHILCQNYRCRYGEIDIIVQRKQYLHFVEVKARSSLRYGRPADAVDWRKRRRLIRTAEEYLSHDSHILPEIQYYLFDIVEIDLTARTIHVLPDAFGWSR